MVIYSNRTYRIAFQEDTDCNIGAKLVMNDDPHDPPYLEFKGGELFESICIMGLLPNEVVNKGTKLKRSEEFKFKKFMVQAVLTEYVDRAGKKCLAINEDALNYFDSSEKSAISYWLGMFFATLLAKHEYGFQYIVHYSRLLKCKDYKYKIVNKPYKDPITNKDVILSSPDLIAMDGTQYNYGVFEAKGYQTFDKRTMNKAVLQARQICSIEGDSNLIKLVAYSRLKNNGITIRTKDPVDGDLAIRFDKYQALLWQYQALTELFRELVANKKTREENGYIVCDGLYEGINEMSLDSKIYSYISEHENILQESYLDDFIDNLDEKGIGRRAILKEYIESAKKNNMAFFYIV